MNDMPMFLMPFLWYGVTFSLVSAELLERPRLWIKLKLPLLGKMLECTFCTGFHVGWFCYLLLVQWSFWHHIPYPHLTLHIVLQAFTAAAFCYVLDVSIQAMEKYVHG